LIKVIYYLIATNIREVAVADLGILGFRELRHLDCKVIAGDGQESDLIVVSTQAVAAKV
jgi:hypothetical protein